VAAAKNQAEHTNGARHELARLVQQGLAGRDPRRVELSQELAAALILVDLADGTSAALQPMNRSQEAQVRLVLPAYEPTTSPPIGPKGVEPPVIANSERGVTLDCVSAMAAEFGPAVEVTGEGGYNCGNGSAALSNWLGQSSR